MKLKTEFAVYMIRIMKLIVTNGLIINFCLFTNNILVNRDGNEMPLAVILVKLMRDRGWKCH